MIQEGLIWTYDSKTKKISPYLWKTTCEHMKGLKLARG